MMKDSFQREMLERLTRIETQLKERCAVRGEALEDIFKRLSALEAIENKRRGGVAMMLGMLSVAGALGGIVSRLWPWQ